MESLLQDAGHAALSDTAEHQVYDEAIKQVKNEEEVHARHILVPTEDEAKAILAQLKGGADFAALAKEKSKDPGAAEGGDLGYFTKDQMVPEFAEVAFKLDKGQLSDPVKTQFGWHIIKVEDKRIKPTPTFEQVKAADRQLRRPSRARRSWSKTCATPPMSSASTSRWRRTPRSIPPRRRRSDDHCELIQSSSCPALSRAIHVFIHLAS